MKECSCLVISHVGANLIFCSVYAHRIFLYLVVKMTCERLVDSKKCKTYSLRKSENMLLSSFFVKSDKISVTNAKLLFVPFISLRVHYSISYF